MSKQQKLEENKSREIDKLKIVAIVISMCALIVSILSSYYTQKTYFYSRVFQPLNYYYKFDLNDSEKTTCKCKTTSGCIKKLMVVSNTDNDTYTIFDMSVKEYNEQLLSDSNIEFELRFYSNITEGNKRYDYAFIYLEGTDSAWYLDCIIKEYEDNKQPNIIIYEKADLLRLKIMNNEAEKIILNDYEKLYKEFSRINKG